MRTFATGRPIGTRAPSGAVSAVRSQVATTFASAEPYTFSTVNGRSHDGQDRTRSPATRIERRSQVGHGKVHNRSAIAVSCSVCVMRWATSQSRNASGEPVTSCAGTSTVPPAARIGKKSTSTRPKPGEHSHVPLLSSVMPH